MRYRVLCVWMTAAWLCAAPLRAQDQKGADAPVVVLPVVDNTAQLAKDLAALSKQVDEVLRRVPAADPNDAVNKAVAAFEQAWAANLASATANVCRRSGGEVVVTIADSAVTSRCEVRNKPRRRFLGIF